MAETHRQRTLSTGELQFLYSSFFETHFFMLDFALLKYISHRLNRITEFDRKLVRFFSQI